MHDNSAEIAGAKIAGIVVVVIIKFILICCCCACRMNSSSGRSQPTTVRVAQPMTGVSVSPNLYPVIPAAAGYNPTAADYPATLNGYNPTAAAASGYNPAVAPPSYESKPAR